MILSLHPLYHQNKRKVIVIQDNIEKSYIDFELEENEDKEDRATANHQRKYSAIKLLERCREVISNSTNWFCLVFSVVLV